MLCFRCTFALFFVLGIRLLFPEYSLAAAIPTQIVVASSGQCVVPASSARGAQIVQRACSESSSAYWSLAQVGTGYQIISQSSGMCLNVAGALANGGVPLTQWPCQPANGGLNDKWAVASAQSGASDYFTLRAMHSGMCANVANASLGVNASLVQDQCQIASTLSNQFYLNPSALPSMPTSATSVGSVIMAAGSGQCLQASNGSTAPGAQLIQAVCGGLSSQAWSAVPVGSYYHVVSQNSGLCLSVSPGSTDLGLPLTQGTCQDGDTYNDQWSMVSVPGPAGNFYHLVARSNGLCANVFGSSLDPGATIVQWACQDASTLNDQFAIEAASPSNIVLPSSWSPVIPLPVNAISAANLPNGNLLLWSAYAQFAFEGDISDTKGQTYYSIFNPVTQTSTQARSNSAGADLFCPGTALLPNGNILVNGGSSSPKTTVYNVATGKWQADANMVVPRGYEADTLLSNGSVFTFGGSWSGGSPSAKNAEVWTGGQGWFMLNNASDESAIGPDPAGYYRGDNHMWLFAQSHGYVFHAGPSAQMHWIGTTDSGSIKSAGNRGNDPYSINGDAVLYDIGKILKVGGALAYDQVDGSTTYANNSAYTIDISGGPNAAVKVRQLRGMNYARAFANAVVLPTGDVVVVGGQSIPQVFTDRSAVLVPELWNHTAQTFTALKPMQTPRTYHSTALLLPDGRVFVGGGGQCGEGCADNHLNAEILTPPYLLNADGSAATRPLIVSAPSQAAPGSALTVTTNSVVSSFALVRLSATTHTVNNDQRRVPLRAVLQAGSTLAYTVTIPADPGIVLPGYYMLFAMNAKGVPSIAATVQIN